MLPLFSATALKTAFSAFRPELLMLVAKECSNSAHSVHVGSGDHKLPHYVHILSQTVPRLKHLKPSHSPKSHPISRPVMDVLMARKPSGTTKKPGCGTFRLCQHHLGIKNVKKFALRGAKTEIETVQCPVVPVLVCRVAPRAKSYTTVAGRKRGVVPLVLLLKHNCLLLRSKHAVCVCL